jgi:phosphoglycerate dehydrogenase-like enzyme
MKVAFAGSFTVRLAEPVRARLAVPCEIVADEDARIIPRLNDADVLVSMSFSQQMAAAAPRLRLVQVPGAGLDRIENIARRAPLNMIGPAA